MFFAAWFVFLRFTADTSAVYFGIRRIAYVFWTGMRKGIAEFLFYCACVSSHTDAVTDNCLSHLLFMSWAGPPTFLLYIKRSKCAKKLR